jgi:hypothetical protein
VRLACQPQLSVEPFWSVPSATANNVPTIGNAPGSGATLWGTLDASSIAFSSTGGYSPGGFLNSLGAASNIIYQNGATAATSLTNILFEFKGTASFTNGQSFNVLHDDGVNLYVNNQLVLGAPNITGPITTPYTYTGPTGNFDFIYANGPASQAEFRTNLSQTLVDSGVLEPSALLLLAVGLAGILAVRHPVKKSTSRQAEVVSMSSSYS